MKKQDDSIQKLFDDYASELKPRDELSSAAREEMTVLNVKRKPSSSARKNKSFAPHLGWIIPVSVVVLFVLVLNVFSPIFKSDDSSGGNQNAQNPTPSEIIYTFADVKGRQITIDDCDELLKISRLKVLNYDVLNERYCAFYTDDGELRYIKAMIGVRDANGVFTEIILIAEVDGYVRSDLNSIYRTYSSRDRLVCNSDFADNGEYVTQAYFAARNMHFYVEARNGQVTDIAQTIISVLL